MTILAMTDIETTGLNWKDGDKIIEVAVGLYKLEDKRFIGSYVQRVNPERSVSIEAERIHKISFSELIKEPVWKDVAPKVEKVLSFSNIVVAHNGAGFDFPFLEHELKSVGIKMPEAKQFDTMLNGRWATMLGKYPNLGELCFACNVDYDPEKAHSALYDVQVMADCFFVGYEKGFYKI